MHHQKTGQKTTNLAISSPPCFINRKKKETKSYLVRAKTSSKPKMRKFPLITVFYRDKQGSLPLGHRKPIRVINSLCLQPSLASTRDRAGGGGDPASTLALNPSMLYINMRAYFVCLVLLYLIKCELLNWFH